MTDDLVIDDSLIEDDEEVEEEEQEPEKKEEQQRREPVQQVIEQEEEEEDEPEIDLDTTTGEEFLAIIKADRARLKEQAQRLEQQGKALQTLDRSLASIQAGALVTELQAQAGFGAAGAAHLREKLSAYTTEQLAFIARNDGLREEIIDMAVGREARAKGHTPNAPADGAAKLRWESPEAEAICKMRLKNSGKTKFSKEQIEKYKGMGLIK